MMRASVSCIAERQRAIRDALRHEWDPIGVGQSLRLTTNMTPMLRRSTTWWLETGAAAR